MRQVKYMQEIMCILIISNADNMILSPFDPSHVSVPERKNTPEHRYVAYNLKIGKLRVLQLEE